MAKNCIFILPTGLVLGGTTTWSANMSIKLTNLGLPATLIRHTEEENYPPNNDPVLSQLRIVDCPGKPAWLAYTTDDLIPYIPTYHSVLPGTIIPNWSYATYATCALISLTNAHNLRIIGVAHTDEPMYYDYLKHYEPIIHIFVAVSEDIAAKLKKVIPDRQDDIVTRPCGVDIPSQLVRGYSTTPEAIKLTYAGRIENDQKRIYDLVNLAKILEKNKVNFHLKIIGSGDQETWLCKEINLVNASSERQRITFEGGVPYSQMPDCWKDTDICVLVSNYEGTSISMLEAMAQGCVPVVTNVSGTKIISNGINGFTVPVGDMEKMAYLIEELTNDRSKLQQVGTYAYQTILNNYSFEKYVPWLVELNDLVWKMPPRQWPENRPLIHKKLPEKRSLSQRILVKSMGSLKKLIHLVYGTNR
jgi:glycosyltransferase involved in cell wall biosynthesis